MKRAKTIATRTQHATQIATANMTRSSSSRSAGANPFSGSARITPPNPNMQAANGGMLADYLDGPEMQQPANTYMFAHSVNRGPSQARRPGLPPVAEGEGMTQMMNIEDWLSQRGDNISSSPMGTPSLSTAPMAVPSRDRLSPLDAIQQMPMNMGLSSQCGSLTSAPTMETPMTRSNSNANQSVSGQLPIQMMRLSSQSSGNDGLRSQDTSNFGNTDQSLSLLGKRNASNDDFLQIGSNLPSNLSSFDFSSSTPADSVLSQDLVNMQKSISMDSRRSAGFVHPSSVMPNAMDNSYMAQFSSPMERTDTQDSQMSSQSFNNQSFLPPNNEHYVSMERSISASSAKSSQSLKDRAKEALNRVNHHAKMAAVLMPKPAADPSKLGSTSQLNNKTDKGGKVAVAKAKYERPKHPKVKCNQCDECPDGFRGEHELRRHTEAKHRGVVKKWVCRDPNTAGISSEVEAINALDKCKQCKAGKQYGAYYNAAAHLRRTHFKAKPARGKAANGAAKNKNGTSDEPAEKRGGKGGGDWPPMVELKKWMEEVQVSISEPGAFDSFDETNTAYDGEDMPDVEYLDNNMSPMTTNLPAGSFDNTVFGLGGNLTMDINNSLQNLDGTFQSLPEFANVPLAHQNTLHGMPVSSGSANFDFNSPISHGLFPQGLVIDGNAYHSPNVSSVNTVTPGNVGYHDQQHFSQTANTTTSQLDDLGELDFNSMMFSGGMSATC